MIRILLVEDDEVFRLGLSVGLKTEADLELVAACGDGHTAIELAGQHQPDVILMDLGLPTLNGMEATRQIKALYPDIRILALTSNNDAARVDDMMDAGADGFCLKGLSPVRLASVIRDVHSGVFWIDADVVAHIRRRFQPKDASAGQTPDVPTGDSPLKFRLDNLTERETEILLLIAEGKKNIEIADKLCISHGTVRVHVHSILQKLNVRDRTEAALFIKKLPTNPA